MKVLTFLLFIFYSHNIVLAQENVGQSIQLTNSEQTYLNSINKITYCVDPDWMPFEALIDGKLIGMSADFLQLAAKTLNKPFELVVTNTWRESLKNAEKGICNILPLTSITNERIEYLDFTEPYLYYTSAIISQESLPFIPSLDSLKNMKIAIISGSTWRNYATKNDGNNEFIEVNTVEDGLLMTSSGQVSAFLIALPVAAYHIKRLGLTNLKVAGHIEVRRELRFAVSKKSISLFPIIQKLAHSLNQQDIDIIYNRWQSIRYEHSFNYSLLWKLALGIAFIAAFFSYRYQVMNSFNKRLMVVTEELEQTNIELKKLSQTDSLTSLYNRRFIEEKASYSIKVIKRYTGHMSLILIDIDKFKNINDTYGHEKGDEVLKAITKILEKRVRETDLVGRWGGEEFIVLCMRTELTDALLIAENLRCKIETLQLSIPEKITASFGVAEYNGHESLDELVARTDKKLYAAKNNGRNQVK